ncbi:MAG TPA: phage holin family protein, partial [Xanthomonadales bacterium]|nr:phage holin family protein [Xanthomonadales bacterium]
VISILDSILLVKTILRKIAIYTFTLFLLPSLIPGVKISGGLETLFIGGAALALMFLVLRPILNIISFPIRLITLGLFSIITNALILYLMTRFVEGISIGPFTYPELNFLGFSTPEIDFNIYIAYVFTAFVISVIESTLSWLME